MRFLSASGQALFPCDLPINFNNYHSSFSGGTVNTNLEIHFIKIDFSFSVLLCINVSKKIPEENNLYIGLE